MVTVGLLGVGNIGSMVLRRLLSGELGDYTVIGAADVMGAGEQMVTGAGIPYSRQVDTLIAMKPDLIVETASQAAVREWAVPILSSGINLVTLSVGALADCALVSELERVAVEHGVQLMAPSGAIGGLDVLKAARIAGLDFVEIVTTKPPAALRGAPGLAGLDLDKITEATVVFEGSATAAAQALPQNLNVAVAVGLCGVGVENTKVTVVADPNATVNCHQVKASGAFGSLDLKVENKPSPDNPKTSYLAILSALSLLKQLSAPIKVGS